MTTNTITTIPESELILNLDGSVYHLNLLPEDIADTIILVGDPDRTAKVSKFFDEIELKKQKREFVTHTGYLNKKRMTVISTGIGTDNIDIVLNELDALVNIDLKEHTVNSEHKALNLIRFGTSGALQKDIPVDSYVVASHGVGLDIVMNYYKRDLTPDEDSLQQAFLEHIGKDREYIRPYISEGSRELINLFKETCIEGMTAAGCGFYGPQGRVLRCELAMPHLIDNLTHFQYHGHRITNFEMETSVVYGLGRLLGHRCCSINFIICNRLAGTASADYHGEMNKMFQMGLETLSHI